MLIDYRWVKYGEHRLSVTTLILRFYRPRTYSHMLTFDIIVFLNKLLHNTTGVQILNTIIGSYKLRYVQ
uniref:Uncharacterized protein n=1 Tax=Pararge aegeria TaxID=116150 RepID=S4NQE0_9NEOP